MAILLWVGENDYGIAQQLEALKRKLQPDWIAFNYHAFSPFALTDALAAARTPPVMDKCKVIVVKTCNFSQVMQFGERQWEALQSIDQFPNSTTFVFIAASIDRRLKIVKHLLKSATLKEFPLISPWRTDLIAGVIAAQAKAMQISLDRECVNYLAEAIGNDQTRAAAELKKLQVYAQGKRLTLAAVQALVPCRTQTSLQLAEAIRKGDAARTLNLLDALLTQAELPIVILSTLTTQFRTWLWVKSAIADATRRKDAEIAQLCGIGNPNRLYYLRKEVAAPSLKALGQAVTQLFELEVALKQGAGAAALMPGLLAISRLFKSRKSLA